MCWARTRVLQSYQSRHYQPEKLAFYQLNYSRSVVPIKYRKIIGFTARAVPRESGNPDSTTGESRPLFSMQLHWSVPGLLRSWTVKQTTWFSQLAPEV